MMKPYKPAAILLVVLGLLAPALARQDNPGNSGAPPPPDRQPPTPPTPPAGSAVARADLAAAYLRLEHAFFAGPPTGRKLADINTTFDSATTAYFSGQFGEAVRLINHAANSLLPESKAPDGAMLLAQSIKVVIDPPVYVLGAGRPSVTFTSMYPAELSSRGGSPLRLTLLLHTRAAGGPESRTPLDVPVDESPVRVHIADNALNIAGLAPGTYEVALLSPRGDQVAAGTFCIATHSLGATRLTNADRIARLVVETPELIHALGICRARNALLTDRPSPANSAEFLADLPALETELDAEVRALSDLRNPYRRRTGDYWRPVAVGSTDVPSRLYAPKQAAGDTPLPLVIALHGAGGDESLFPEAYGAGIIKTLADQHGFILLAPQVGPFSATPDLFDTIVESVSLDYAVDPARIYVIGHSMGGGVVAAWSLLRADRIAAVCSIAGVGSFPSVGPIPPTLVIAAGRDPVVPAERVERAAGAAKEAGLPVEFRRIEGYGHSFVVGAALPGALPWLLEHRLGQSGAKPPVPPAGAPDPSK